ncbi:Cas10/Cmr2 second palm domain-containing protein [Sulfobacillus thermosulfidooxidans]|uniref:Cas10/Cmr2 second palm domain-containing protein n=1 Tax=Sulfobacillus thermosulfidooxidans TaxID=28034 RepID=UPI0006B4A01F|nr:type III-B CRISPR-associated protein Cas10/Cmr2 [Sulfobacillus thermosulfidooxidans]
MKRLHFSLGPVQSFVSQARRTRDLWAGSFLLSYLTGHAMNAIISHGSEIEFPIVTDFSANISDPLLRSIHDHVETGPYIGSLPNRFVALVPDSFQPLWCLEAIHNQWNTLANTVWTHFIEPVSNLGQDTQTIWTEQITNFWEITWVIGEEPDLLDRRKNWRSQTYPVQGGRKCSMMPQWQEISGHVTNPQARETFWHALRQTISRHVGILDLQEGEELSAIALVKRLFPYIAKEAIGWSVPLSYRSTVDLAAATWVYKQCKSQPAVCEAYAREGKPLVRRNKVLPASWEQLAQEQPSLKSFMKMDANSWYPNTLLNDRLWDDNDSRTLRAHLANKLKEFKSSPDTYFAILLMDGDHLGRLLRTFPPRDVSAALKEFTERVPEIVQNHEGELIYAGGDDVLALFPVENSLTASVALREHYARVMKGMGTISAAIVYGYYHAPLTELIHYAHYVLDHIAKDENGRDSLALAVMTSGGPSSTWATKWDVLQFSSLNRLEYLATQVQKRMSSQFLFKISETESKLGSQNFMDDDFWEHLFAYELTRTREREIPDQTEESPDTISRTILDLFHGYHGKTDESRFQDLLYLIHFLSKRMRLDA